MLRREEGLMRVRHGLIDFSLIVLLALVMAEENVTRR